MMMILIAALLGLILLAILFPSSMRGAFAMVALLFVIAFIVSTLPSPKVKVVDQEAEAKAWVEQNRQR